MLLPGTILTESAKTNGFKYPACQKDWEKIVPQGNFYKAEWIPLYNNFIDYQLECTPRMNKDQYI